MSKKKRSRGKTRRGRSWQPLAALFGLALALVAIILVAQAQGSSGHTPPEPQATSADVVPSPSPSPSPSPTPSPTPQPTPQIIANTQPLSAPTVDVTRVVTTATSATRQLQCLPLEFQSYAIRATITVANPVGGWVTYHWQSSDGFISPDKSVWFAPGQTSAVVTDTWTLGAGNANGVLRWEEAVVTGPQTLTSNRASFIYSCPPMIANMYVEAVQTSADCSSSGAGYEVYAPVTIFAPAGGSVTFEWQNTDTSGHTVTVKGTLRIRPGFDFVNVVAYWLIGGDQNPDTGGVTAIGSNGQTLSTGTVTNNGGTGGTPTPTPSPTPTSGCQPETVSGTGITISDAAAIPNLASGNDGIFSCPTSGLPTLTTNGAIALTATQSGTITYYWQRTHGTTTVDTAPQTVTVNAGDTTKLVPPDLWTPEPNQTKIPYADVLVITSIDGQPLATPFASNAAFFPDLCA